LPELPKKSLLASTRKSVPAGTGVIDPVTLIVYLVVAKFIAGILLRCINTPTVPAVEVPPPLPGIVITPSTTDALTDPVREPERPKTSPVLCGPSPVAALSGFLLFACADVQIGSTGTEGVWKTMSWSGDDHTGVTVVSLSCQ